MIGRRDVLELPVGPRFTELLETSPPSPNDESRPFAVEIHTSLEIREVAFVAAHELRPLVPCDRVSVLECRGGSYRLLATSGVVGVPPKSRQSLLLQQLVGTVMGSGRRFHHGAGEESIPNELGRQLDAYLAASGCHDLLIEPICEFRPSQTKSPRAPTVVGAVVFEQFQADPLTAADLARIAAAMQHVIPAFHNARQYSRLTSVPGLRWLGSCWQLMQSSRTLYWSFCALLLASLIWGANQVEQPFELGCRGKLMPVERRQIYAALDGEIVEVFVGESEVVEQGQLLARMTSVELEKSLLEQTGLLQTKLKARESARAELHAAKASRPKDGSPRDQAQLEILHAEISTIQQQLKLLETQRQLLEIRAPLAGTITTPRPQDALARRPVRRGDPLLEIMCEDGDWQLELDLPERDLGHLLQRKTQHTANVDFRLLSNPQDRFRCQVTRVADRARASREQGAVCPVYCDVTEVELPERRIGTEVAAKLDCGRASLCFLWFHEFWELLYRNWWL